jgi:ribitol 2-dehydrogenase
MNHPLEGKVVIVTGASSGIGKASAQALAKCGAKLTLAARSTHKLEELQAVIGAAALVVPTDVTNANDVSQMVEKTLEHFGQIDVLFANAGIYVPGQVSEGNPDDWAQLMDTNVNGVLRSVRAVLPHMLERGTGDILVTSSISGHETIHWEPVYSASKHAIQAFVHALRRQVAAKGVRVGSIAPGIVLNDLWGELTPELIEKKVSEHAGLRSEDVADAVVYMLSLPRHITIRDLVMLPQNQDI